MKKSFNENAAIRGAIRRVFARSPLVREVLMEGRREVPRYNKDGSRHKKDAVQYQCQVCMNWVSSTKVAVDHIEPVISVEHGFQDWNEFIARLWCEKSNLQRICDDCHQNKTNAERFARNYKKDLELIAQLEVTSDLNKIRDGIKKFTKKKLEQYPPEFFERVQNLKEVVKKR